MLAGLDGGGTGAFFLEILNVDAQVLLGWDSFVRGRDAVEVFAFVLVLRNRLLFELLTCWETSISGRELVQ